MESKHFMTWNGLTAVPLKAKEQVNFIIASRSGIMRIGNSLQEKMGLKASDRLEFFQGTENTKEWFVSKSKNPEGLSLRFNQKWKCLYFSAKLMATELLNITKHDSSVKIRVSAVPEAMPKMEGLPAAAFRMYVNEVK